MVNLDLVYFDAGGGHRSAARALAAAIEEQRRPWQCRLLNLQEVLDPIDICRRLTGVRGPDIYNGILKKGWTAGSAGMIWLVHFYIRRTHADQVSLLNAHWRESRPNLVVSLIPHYNRALQESLQAVWPGTPLVTILTDLADYPPAFWMQSREQHVVCGTSRAVEQARALGCPEDRIWRTSGMILDPRFYQPVCFDREEERRRLGLDARLPAALVLFGGHGSQAMLEIAKRLSKARAGVQLILLCGRNLALANRLRAADLTLPKLVVEHTLDVPYYMSLADLFIGKPGPGSVSEALAMGLPVIVERSARTMMQERYNAEWVLEQQVGVVVKGFRKIDLAVEQMIDSANYAGFRASIARIRNRAVFEIPGILDSILERAGAGQARARVATFSPKNVLLHRFNGGMTM
jgi:1,2-diacylglycerol 3-beta-galactosyltransferase